MVSESFCPVVSLVVSVFASTSPISYWKGRKTIVIAQDALLHSRLLSLFSLFFQYGQTDKPLAFFHCRHCLIFAEFDFRIRNIINTSVF